MNLSIQLAALSTMIAVGPYIGSAVAAYLCAIFFNTAFWDMLAIGLPFVILIFIKPTISVVATRERGLALPALFIQGISSVIAVGGLRSQAPARELSLLAICLATNIVAFEIVKTKWRTRPELGAVFSTVLSGLLLASLAALTITFAKAGAKAWMSLSALSTVLSLTVVAAASKILRDAFGTTGG